MDSEIDCELTFIQLTKLHVLLLIDINFLISSYTYSICPFLTKQNLKLYSVECICEVEKKLIFRLQISVK